MKMREVRQLENERSSGENNRIREKRSSTLYSWLYAMLFKNLRDFIISYHLSSLIFIYYFSFLHLSQHSLEILWLLCILLFFSDL